MHKTALLLAFAGLIAARAAGETPPVPQALSRETPVEVTAHSEIYALPGGGRRAVIHMRKQEPEPSARAAAAMSRTSPNGAGGSFTDSIEGDGFRCRFSKGNPRSGSVFEGNGYSVKYTPADNYAGAEILIDRCPGGVKESVIITEGAPTELSWHVETDADVRFEGGGLIFTGGDGTCVFTTPAPTAFDAAMMPVDVETTFEDGLLTCRLAGAENVCWPVVLDPSVQLALTTAGTSYVWSGEATWQAARDRTSATTASVQYLQVGPWETSGTFGNYRAFLTIPVEIPAFAVVDSAFLCLDGIQKIGSTFTIYGVSGTQSGAVGVEEYTQFRGMRSGLPHLPVYLTEEWSTSQFSSGVNRLRFTAAGRDSIAAANGDSLRICLINKTWDIDNAAWTTASVVCFESNARYNGGIAPYLEVYYHEIVSPPANFAMTAVDSATISCSWDDMSSNEERFIIQDALTSAAVDTVDAGSESAVIGGLIPNGKYVWRVVADSSGVRAWSPPDSAFALLPPPREGDITVMPVSSDSLRVTLTPPENASLGATGMEVEALSGSGATSSGALTGTYSYRDGGLDPASAYVYRTRYINGDGIPSSWSAAVVYAMNGRDTATLTLPGDLYDDYTAGGVEGYGDSTVVRAGRDSSGEALHGLFSFELPWELHKGGVDSLFLSLNRTAENAATSPMLTVRLIPDGDIEPVETRPEAASDTTGVSVCWTISNGVGEKCSPDLRPLFERWRDMTGRRDYHAGFGLRLEGGSAAAGAYAVFNDASNPLYAGDTYLTVYFTPGTPDTLRGAPTDAALTAISPDSIRVTWHDTVDGEYGFVVVEEPGGTVVAGTDTLSAGAESADAGGLTPDTTYRWKVRALTRFDTAESGAAETLTPMRTPGKPAVTPVSATSLKFVLDPADNPSWTVFAVQDSVTGLYVDAAASPDTLRPGPPGDWGRRTFAGWGAAAGDTLGGLAPDSLFVLRAKAVAGDEE